MTIYTPSPGASEETACLGPDCRPHPQDCAWKLPSLRPSHGRPSRPTPWKMVGVQLPGLYNISPVA